MQHMEADHEFIRYQAVEPNHRGVKIGIFGLANGLAREGALTEQDYQWWTKANTWYDDAYPDPSTIDPSVYDRGVNPQAQAWFKTTAGQLLARVPHYLTLLDRYGVNWEISRSSNPGIILYEDDVQVVVNPYQ